MRSIIFLFCLAIGLTLPFLSKAQSVYFEDKNWEQRLLKHSAINTNGDDSIQIAEAQNYTGKLPAYIMGATRLTSFVGIEYFINITSLATHSGTPDTLDIRPFKKLKELEVSSRDITHLIIEQNLELETLTLQYSEISVLQLHECPNLTSLTIRLTQLSELNLQPLKSLTLLNITNCQLNALNIENQPLLKKLYCYNNQLNKLDVRANPLLEEIMANENEIDSFLFDTLSSLTKLRLNHNRLKDLHLPATPLLTDLKVSFNDITSLQLENAPLLAELDFENNRLETIDLSGFPKLTYLNCNNNLIAPTLEVAHLTLLKSIHCLGNKIETLNLSKNIYLTYLNALGNQLTFLNIKNGYTHKIYDLNTKGNPDLDCIQIDPYTHVSKMERWYYDPTTQFSEVCAKELPESRTEWEYNLPKENAITTNHLLELGAPQYMINHQFTPTYNGSLRSQVYFTLSLLPGHNKEEMEDRNWHYMSEPSSAFLLPDSPTYLQGTPVGGTYDFLVGFYMDPYPEGTSEYEAYGISTFDFVLSDAYDYHEDKRFDTLRYTFCWQETDEMCQELIIGNEPVISRQYSSLTIFPNPTQGEINLRIDQSVLQLSPYITIYDFQGKNVFQNQLNETNLTLHPSLSPGIYLMELDDGKNHLSRQKLIVK